MRVPWVPRRRFLMNTSHFSTVQSLAGSELPKASTIRGRGKLLLRSPTASTRVGGRCGFASVVSNRTFIACFNAFCYAIGWGVS
jgi:hypothetical protein